MEVGPAPSDVQPEHTASAADAVAPLPEESDQPAYLLEYARSGRARCKGRKPCHGLPIDKGTLRLGVLVTFGCVTDQQLFKMSKKYAAADEIGGFRDLELEDKIRVTKAFQNGCIELEEMSLMAPSRKGGPLRSVEPEDLEPDESDVARANGSDEYAYAGSSTEHPERAPNPSRKSRGMKLPNYDESGDNLEDAGSEGGPGSVDVQPQLKKEKLARKQPKADEAVEPSLKRVKSEDPENVKPLSQQAKSTRAGGRRVKKQAGKASALAPAPDDEKPVVKVQKERKLKEIQPGPTIDAQGYPVRRSGRHRPKAETA